MVTAQTCRDIAAEKLALAKQNPKRSKALTGAADAWLLLATRLDHVSLPESLPEEIIP